MHVLWQLQLSNYYDGKFSLTGDSNWTTFVMKARELKKHDPDLTINVLVPGFRCVHEDVKEELRKHGLAEFVIALEINIPLNAIASRYDFSFSYMRSVFLNWGLFDVVYVNDPCLVGNYRAVMHDVKSKALLVSQCHFLDSGENPLVPPEVSYWHRTVEATEKADLNVWHCHTQMMEWADLHPFNHDKSVVWKSGHSTTMLDEPINMANIRFDYNAIPNGTTVVWVPNRIGGLGKSFDYTNNGRFLFDEMPKYGGEQVIILCGNPSQKITNDEIAERVPEYMKLVPGAMNYDEYKWCTQRANIVVALYDKDSNGGIAVLEAMYHGAMPLMPDINEYSRYFDDINFPFGPRVSADLSDIAQSLTCLMQWKDEDGMGKLMQLMPKAISKYSIEESTKQFYEVLNAKLATI